MWNSNIAPERWHNHQGLGSTTLYQTYGTPSAWYRRSYYTISKNESDVVKDEYNFIRAAAVFKTGVPLTPFTVNVEYSLICDIAHRGWKVMLVSCADPVAWLSRAYEAGAVAWWLCSPGPVFEYVPRVYPDSREETDTMLESSRGPGKYDRDQVMWDLKNSTMSQQAIGNKYGITRSMVSVIARQLRNLEGVEAKPRRGPVMQMDPKLLPLVKRDIMTGRMNKEMIANKHGVTKQNITSIVDTHGLAGYLPRGTSTAKLIEKYFKNAP
ncbi:hypothetical protein UFOVP642_32 [uncultured Caudovirales phage]|uniref:Uncharacterized protein n=1 Tax=uncultured Caudovirales phage TaxID=2100421 RepID=A0A6J5N6T8_9CAUD|nr:hypothetical protein UFOVP642_32 [uncultured Caudovirales phage]